MSIVENPESAPASTYELDTEPNLVIGATVDAPEYELYFVTGARRLSDGRVAVVNFGTQEIRLYSPDGEYQQSLGGSGDGPGEFREIGELRVLRGDTLLVWDAGRQSRVWFTPDGELLRTERLEAPRWTGQFAPDRMARVTSVFPDGGFLLGLRADGQYPPGPRRAYLGFAWAVGADQEARLLGEYGGPEEFNFGDRSQGLFHPMPFRRSTHHAVGADPTRVFVGGMREGVDGYEIDVFGRDGEREMIIRHLRPLPEIPHEVRDSIVSRERTALESRIAPDRLTSFVASVATVYPPHGPLFVDSEGYLWIQESSGRDDLQRYLVADPTGTIVAQAETPPRFRILDIGDDYVLGVWMDAMNVEFVQLYGLSRG